MRTSKAAIAASLAGAVALASAAYGIGTQSGDGTADARGGTAAARDEPRDPRMAHFFGLDDLAAELGVDADELRNAFEDFHERQDGRLRDDFAAALAEALGKPVDDVEAALDDARPGDRRRGPCGPGVSLRRLAAELDVTQAELRSALREVRTDARDRFDDRREALVQFLAERFNLSEDEVEDALPDLPGPLPHGPPGPRPGWGAMPG
jgi:CO/xanthine dehydrogenase Mo-binding subunit